MSEPSCDVVIASRNRPRSVVQSLHGLRRQTFTDFRVVLVDDHSDPGLAPRDRLGEFGDLRLDLVELPARVGPAAARNAGVRACTAEYVAFIDDDVVPDRQMLAVHMANVRDRGVGDPPVVSFGPFVQPADWTPTPWNLWEARQAKKEADAMLRGDYAPTWRQFHTGNNCLPVRLFRDVGGFDERFTRAEDDEFGLRVHRAGAVFRFAPAAIAWHYSHRTLDAWLSIPRSYARFDVEIDALHPDGGYLRAKRAELAARRLPLRVVRRVCAGRRASDAAVRTAVGVAQALHRVRADDLALAALSVAYDVSYSRALAEHTAASARSAEGGT